MKRTFTELSFQHKSKFLTLINNNHPKMATNDIHSKHSTHFCSQLQDHFTPFLSNTQKQSSACVHKETYISVTSVCRTNEKEQKNSLNPNFKTVNFFFSLIHAQPHFQTTHVQPYIILLICHAQYAILYKDHKITMNITFSNINHMTKNMFKLSFCFHNNHSNFFK